MSNPLLQLHREGGAETQGYGEVEIVSTFGQPEAEYAAISKACGMIDLPQRGVLELTGADRLSFLNNWLTNQTWSKETKSGLAAGQGVYAFFLNLKGRIACDMNILELGDRTLLEMDGRVVETVRKEFDKYLFAEQVKMASRLDDLHEFALHGPGAVDLLNQILDSPLPPLDPLAVSQARLLGMEIIIWRDDPAAVPGFHLVIASRAVLEIWTNLLSRFGQSDQLGKRPLRPVGWAAYNATRIEGGRPIFGIDFDDSILPAETGLLERAVSFTKGCYLGQEIVARMHARGQVAKQLVGVRMEGDALPIAGAKAFDDQSNEIGGITSSTISPVRSNAALCLGYLKKPHFTVGTTVNIPAEGAMRKGTVVSLPFA